MTRSEIYSNVLEILEDYCDDLDIETDEFDEETLFVDDLHFESLEVIILANATQDHFDIILPISDYLEAVGQRERPDITIGEWVDFVASHLN